MCVSFFVWCVAWNKILTGDNLRLRGLDFFLWTGALCVDTVGRR